MALKFNPMTGVFDQVGITKPASATQYGYLTAADWTTFNSKLDASRFNYITNPSAEVDASDYNLYNDSGRAAPATYLEQDLLWTAATPPGDGLNIAYVYNASFNFATPDIQVVSPTLVNIRWHNGPTVAANPSATQLKAAWDAVPAAVALATCTIVGTASDLQYQTGSHVLFGGGDTAPVDGTLGSPAGLAFTTTLIAPLVETSSFLFSKDAANRQGQGVSTDFTINSADKGNTLQLSFYYSATAGFTFGSNSDIKVFVYDVTNSAFVTTSASHLTGTSGNIYRFSSTFPASSTSVNYRLILHLSTTSVTDWDVKLDEITVNSVLDATEATDVPSVVLASQPITGAVTDRMAVMWLDGNQAWQPATMASGGEPSNLFGIVKNIVGLTGDIVIRGLIDGMSPGPFKGYNQYVDNTAGGLSPLPSPFTDTGVVIGKGVSDTEIFVQPTTFERLVTSKGGLLTNAGANNGTGDQVLAVGANGNVLIANSAQTTGLQWAPAVVAAAPFTYTLATRTLTIATATNSVAGVLSAADHTTYSGYAATIATKANTATPSFTGDVNSSTGNVLISTLGKGLQVKTGVNSKIGTSVLVAGAVIVANTSVTANSRIFLTSQTDGGTPGFLRVSAKVNATNFTITSSSPLDTSTVAWNIVESIP